VTATGYLGGDPSKLSKSGYAKGDIVASDGTGTLTVLPIGVNSRTLTVDTGQPLDLSYVAGGGAPVSSVFGRNGVVLAVGGDYSVGQVTGAAPLASPTFTGTVTMARSVNTPVSLLDAATIATDASLGNTFRVTLGGNRTLGAPTNPTDGQMAMWEIAQDGAGNRTLALAAGAGAFAFGADITSITLSTAASKVDLLGCRYNLAANRWWVIAFLKGF
jgi:hypothetical protein